MRRKKQKPPIKRVKMQILNSDCNAKATNKQWSWRSVRRPGPKPVIVLVSQPQLTQTSPKQESEAVGHQAGVEEHESRDRRDTAMDITPNLTSTITQCQDNRKISFRPCPNRRTMVFKHTDEVYNIHGQYAWTWRSASARREASSLTSSKMTPLSSGPEKRLINVQGTDGAVKIRPVKFSVYNRLMVKRMAVPVETPNICFDVVRLTDGRVVAYDGREKCVVEEVDQIVSEIVEDMLGKLKCVEPQESMPVAILPSTSAGNGSTAPAPINVSQALADLKTRWRFPKIAYAAPICDQLLANRMKNVGGSGAGGVEKKRDWPKHRRSTHRYKKQKQIPDSTFFLMGGQSKLRKLARSGGRSWSPKEFHFRVSRQHFRRNMQTTEFLLFDKEPRARI